ncbi:hypothetical protein BDZ45DRAFT_192409 [Acephala macrosclerotiorum]|nr:hypothetical protein BDZ45DRAFT_192409 [Acephala macrosclerotiorum]
MDPSMLQPGIFNHPRPKKSVLPHANKKRKIEHKIEEISFDDNSREEYLTGFHKRKVQRIKRAQEEAAKKAKEEHRETRKQLREERKQELEEHVEATNRAIREAEGAVADPGSEEDVWNGIEDEDGAPEPIDHEEEYIDEDKYTTVTVEAVDVSKEGLQKVADEESEASDTEPPQLVKTEKTPKKQWPKKERKKKFRYESKVERKVARAKQKFGNKAKAEGRKGNS